MQFRRGKAVRSRAFQGQARNADNAVSKPERYGQHAEPMNHAHRIEELATALRAARDPGLDVRNRSAWLAVLQRWQADRLAMTFADLQRDPRFGKATRFFLQDLYGEQDVAWRDRDVVRILPTMRRWLPEKLLEVVAGALELDLLTHQLDLATAAALEVSHRGRPRVDAKRYARAYLDSSTRQQRETQIRLLLWVGAELDRLAGSPLLGALLKLARAPARAAGLERMQSFLESGFGACNAMQGHGPEFLSIIHSRETMALEKLCSGDPEPFG